MTHTTSRLSPNALMKELNKIDLPEGYSIEMTGEDEMIADAMQQLYLMLILAVVFIYLIMVAQFPVIPVSVHHHVIDSAGVYRRSVCPVFHRK